MERSERRMRAGHAAEAVEGKPIDDLREDQAAENVRLLSALRERQVILERLSAIQRSIVGQQPLHALFEQITEAACELIGDEVSVVRMRPGGPGTPAIIAASIGVSEKFLQEARRSSPSGLSARAIEENRTIVIDSRPGRPEEERPSEWSGESIHAAIATPAYENGEVVGSVVVASRDPQRVYSSRDQQTMLALAEHVSLALNHARALDNAAHGAFHDSLTGLANRALFLDRVSQSLARAEGSGHPVGVLVVDVDDFKTVNDSLGHNAGDMLLIEVATRLAGSVRPADTVARLGGDEYAVLLDEIADPGAAANAAGRILRSLQMPIPIAGRELFVNASIGIAVGDSDAETLLRDADLAMVRAKGEGKGRFEAFEERMHTEVVERLELDFDLKRGIEREELSLDYQPILSLANGAIYGLESLVRWHHPTLGLVRPDRFIPLAEASGRIHELGHWVLRTACRQAAGWRAEHPGMPIKVGVNVSAAQLHTRDLLGHVAGALAESGLPSGALMLEVTETAVMDDLAIAAARLRELKELGVEIALDDFGVGYSSLRYLQQLPMDYLKIPKPFVDEIDHPNERPPILRAILDLADLFGARSVAEGIEHPEQAERLAQLGCEFGQGHHLCQPISASAAGDLLGDRGAQQAELR